MVQKILKGDTSAAIAIALADGFDYADATIEVRYQGAVRFFRDCVAGQTINFTLTAAETAPMALGAFPVEVRIGKPDGSMITVANASVKIEVTDCIEDVRSGGTIIVDAHGGLYGVDDLPARYTTKDLRDKINEIITKLGGGIAALCLFAGAAFGAGVNVQKSALEDLYNDDQIVTGVTFDASGLVTPAQLSNTVDRAFVESLGIDRGVVSVNSKTGDVQLVASDVGAFGPSDLYDGIGTPTAGKPVEAYWAYYALQNKLNVNSPLTLGGTPNMYGNVTYGIEGTDPFAANVRAKIEITKGSSTGHMSGTAYVTPRATMGDGELAYLAEVTSATNGLAKMIPVDSVNGKTGTVSLAAVDVNAVPLIADKNGGYSSAAIGTRSGVVGNASFSVGSGCTVSGNRSVAFGDGSTASGNDAHAEGERTVASGAQSHAEGYLSTASADQTHAEGYNSSASAANAHAEGFGTTASGRHSHAEGLSTTASADAAHAEGRNTYAGGEASHVGGHRAQTIDGTKYGFSHGNRTVAASGSIALGYQAVSAATGEFTDPDGVTTNITSKHKYAFVWQGKDDGDGTYYHSHGDGTFNVNPIGGLSGFWIGSSSLQTLFNAKQGTISDLSTIRSGASLGATAVQPSAIADMETMTHAAATYQAKGTYLTQEADPTIKAWAKADTKPVYTVAEISGAASSDDLAEVAGNIDDALLYASSVYTFMHGNTNAWFSGTNYVTTADVTNRTHFAWEDGMNAATVPCSFALWEIRDGQKQVVWDQRDWTAWYWNFKSAQLSNALARVTGELANDVSTNYMKRGWARYTAVNGLDNPDPSALIVDTPKIQLFAGHQWEKMIEVGGAGYWTLTSNGIELSPQDSESTFLTIKDFEGNACLTFRKTASYLVYCECGTDIVSNFSDAQGRVVFHFTTDVQPTAEFSTALELDSFVAEDDAGCPADCVWTGSAGSWDCHFKLKAGIDANSCFARFKVLHEGENVVEHSVPIKINGGICFDQDGVTKKIRPVISGNTVNWVVVQ